MKPDMFDDPEGFTKWVDAEIKRRKREEFVNRSFHKIKRRNIKEFRDAYDALISLNPKNLTHQKIVWKIYDANNPGKALLQWWRGEDK